MGFPFSSWGNGHALTYRALVRALHQRGHDVLFLERDVPWYAQSRDLPRPPYGETRLYEDLASLQHCFAEEVRQADLVMVGSYVPEGIAVGEWVTATTQGVSAFYDIDTPITMTKLAQGGSDYLSPALIPRYDLYLSFSSGPILRTLMLDYGSPQARPLHCSVDPDLYYPEEEPIEWDLGYMGTYSSDRQPGLEEMLICAATWDQCGQFVVAGSCFPEEIRWPTNIQRIEHLPPAQHRHFYNRQRYTLNLTRADMRRAGYSPSVRLFEAAACGTPIISDYWEGLDAFFAFDSEILVTRSTRDVLRYLYEIPEAERSAIATRARTRVLREHTAAQRAHQLESYLAEITA
ncbi:MAG: glycosyltransferase [Caldilineaceae bacterium]